MKLSRLVCCAVAFVFCSMYSNASEHTTQLGFRFLHSPNQDGFVEYDFQPDGTLYYYWFSTLSSSSPDVKEEYFEPVFGVERRHWSFDGSKLTIYRGNKKVSSSVLHRDGQKISWGEFGASKVEKLSFTDALEKYTACAKQGPE